MKILSLQEALIFGNLPMVVLFQYSSHWYGADGTEYVHADQHILKYNPANGTLYSGNDGGLYKSETMKSGQI